MLIEVMQEKQATKVRTKTLEIYNGSRQGPETTDISDFRDLHGPDRPPKPFKSGGATSHTFFSGFGGQPGPFRSPKSMIFGSGRVP